MRILRAVNERSMFNVFFHSSLTISTASAVSKPLDQDAVILLAVNSARLDRVRLRAQVQDPDRQASQSQYHRQDLTNH